MSKRNPSKNHHWWPVGLQSYWVDRDENLSWITPSGHISKKKPANRKIGIKRHGHTIPMSGDWSINFESEFAIDDEVHRIVSGLVKFKPFGRTPSEFISMLRLSFKKERQLSDICNFYKLDQKLHHDLLLLIYSLLIRSPAKRSRYESIPKAFGRPSDEGIGKINMLQNYQAAKDACSKSHLTNHFFVLLHSPIKKFVFGDGCLDWLTSALVAGQIKGRTLVPLTPNLCIFLHTPMSMRTASNCASMHAAPWMVDWINDITQIYSRQKIFFLGRKPKLSDAFRAEVFLEHKRNSDELVSMLEGIVQRN